MDNVNKPLPAVQGTSDDAAVSKLSACLRGYYKDDFIPLFVAKETKRSPLINRGYYARVMAMDMIVNRFLDGTGLDCQIVALGAGSDTTYFRLKQMGKVPKMYVELDLIEVVAKKLGIIEHYEKLHQEMIGVSKEQAIKARSDCRLVTDSYALMQVDLRDIESLETSLRGLPNFDFSKPTLFISECVLCYVKPEESSALLSWMVKSFESVALTTYEQILPDDAFGRTMLGHFERRGCPLLAIRTYPDLESQRKRFADHGFGFTQVFDMNDVYYKCIDKEDLKRAEKLEIFDEFEEWHMMQGHYCVALAVNDKSNAKILSDVKLS